MTFVVNAIKQENKTTDTYNFLLDVDSEALARNIMQACGLILLSISRYDHEKSEFGPRYVKIQYEWQEYQIISSKSFSLKDLCMFFVFCDVMVLDVNSFIDPLDQRQSAKVLDFCKSTYVAEKEQFRLQKIKDEENRKKNLFAEDWLLKKAKISVVWILDKVATLTQNKKIHIPIKDQKWVNEQLDEIKKQRMWSNYEKLKDLMQDLFVTLHSLEDAHYETNKDDTGSIFAWTIVSEADLERQANILEEVKYHSLFGWTVVWFRKNYIGLDILPYLLFLKKDFMSLFGNLSLLLYRFYDILLFSLILILVFLAIVIFVDKVVFLWLPLTSLYYSLVSLWWFSFLLYVAMFFRRKESLLVLSFPFVATVILYYVVFPIIQHSFALK